VSIAACTLKASTQPKRILHVASALSPYLTLTAIFATFIIWNGGVVLGDKSNHIATINLPQMLYLWPFLAFFSWPLLLPTLTAIIPLALTTRLGLPLRTIPQPRPLLPRPTPLIALTLLATLTIHLNTTIHPFTLSDNRHYHFYIFKRLLRPHWLRHLAAPVYISCAWACLSAPAQHPTAAAAAPRGEIAKPARSEDDLGHAGGGEAGARVSGTLATVAVTALTLCSAPLVEPRYCIIPFVVWRMQFPLREGGAARGGGRAAAESGLLRGYGCRLMLLETIWFLTINAVTGYIFLHWTFTWPQEPGVQQRFMW
jgi:alpha-1,2-glucosyltransferase